MACLAHDLGGPGREHAPHGTSPPGNYLLNAPSKVASSKDGHLSCAKENAVDDAAFARNQVCPDNLST
jgi:hypothetical protein